MDYYQDKLITRLRNKVKKVEAKYKNVCFLLQNKKITKSFVRFITLDRATSLIACAYAKGLADGANSMLETYRKSNPTGKGKE